MKDRKRETHLTASDDLVPIFSSFCNHIAQIFRHKQIPLGYILQGVVETGNLILDTTAFNAADVQKVLADAVGALKERKKITCPAPKRCVVVGF